MEIGRRKLAAIMFTDIVGYSALTQKNELLALKLVEEHRAILRPLFGKHEGREIRTIGDAFFVEFPSALEAVQCAIEIQLALRQRNLGQVAASAIRLRIGIHLGDVIEAPEGRNYDIYGDGVNIAARLQFLAKPGGVCFSRTVLDQVRNKLDFRPVHIGPRKLKNIAKPVEIYRIDLDSPPAARLTAFRRLPIRKLIHAKTLVSVGIGLGLAIAGTTPRLLRPSRLFAPSGAERTRVAVLPLNYLSSDKDSEGAYLSDGVTGELIASLSKLPSIAVVAESSGNSGRDEATKSVRQLGEELKVSAVLQGSLQKQGEHLRVVLQLVDVDSQETLWSEGFDGKTTEIFQIQAAIAQRVGMQFHSSAGRALASIRSESASYPLPDREAYLTYLKGKQQLGIRTEESLWKAFELFNDAIRRDPKYPGHYVGAATALHIMAYYGYLSPKDALTREGPFTEKALSLSHEAPEALAARGGRRLYFDHDWLGAEQDFRKALEQAPGYAMGHQFYANLLLALGRFDEAEAQLESAVEGDPLSPSLATSAAFIPYYRGNYPEAIRRLRAVLELQPGYIPAMVWLGKSLVQAGKLPDAIEILEKASRLSAGAPLASGTLGYAYARAGRPEDARKVLAVLDAASRDRYVSAYYPAAIHLALGERPEVWEALSQAVADRSVDVVTLKIDPVFKPIEKEREFLATLQAVELSR